VGAGIAHHALVRLEPGPVLGVEADAAGDDERVLVLLAHLAPVLGVAQHAVGFDLVLLLLLLGVLAALAQLLERLLERVVPRGGWVRKPATSTRRNLVTSSFDCSGVSTGTST